MDERAPSPDAPERRPASAAEARALAHPLRLRILFACRDRARTNKELSDECGSTPGTIHYHLKQLVEQGFLRAEEPRPGPRGSTEQPYRSTGKSWGLDTGGQDSVPLRQVGAEEVLAARGEDIVMLTRLGLNLPDQDLEELVDRLGALVEEFAARSKPSPHRPAEQRPDEAGSVTLFVSLHRSPGDDSR